MTSVPHSGAKSVTPGGSVAGGHTKGPWRTSGVYVESNHGLIGHANFSADLSEGCPEANARLIAAAPDLLAALQGMVSAFGDITITIGGVVQPETDPEVIAARAAIAKATAGETRNAEPIHRRDGDEG